MELPKMKTFVKWSGNKSKHINKFKHLIPEFSGTYIEPFVGSGAMLLYLQPRKWIINDINRDLVNIWKWVKRDPEGIIIAFRNFGKVFKPMSKREKVIYCREITKGIPRLPYNLKRASAYLIMKHCAYMGNIIYDNKFRFTGLDLNISINNRCLFLEENNYTNIRNASKFLKRGGGGNFNKSYVDILKKAKKGDFVFLDPPYIEKHDYSFNYNVGEKIGDSFQKTLKTELKKLDTTGVMWMLTQPDTADVKKMFKGYGIYKIRVYRAITKKFVYELVITNYS